MENSGKTKEETIFLLICLSLGTVLGKIINYYLETPEEREQAKNQKIIDELKLTSVKPTDAINHPAGVINRKLQCTEKREF